MTRTRTVLASAAAVLATVVVLVLAGVIVTPEQRATTEGRSEGACRDQLCPGETEPKRDARSEVAIKRGGQWFIGPSIYFSPGMPGGLYWPSKHPMYAGGTYPEAHVDFRFKAVEFILVSEPHSRGVEWGMQSQLASLNAHGKVSKRETLSPRLERWTTQDGGIEHEWYLATNVKPAEKSVPVLACNKGHPELAMCYAHVALYPDLAADVRFDSRHAQAWPEIYTEVSRVLLFLKRA